VKAIRQGIDEHAPVPHAFDDPQGAVRFGPIRRGMHDVQGDRKASAAYVAHPRIATAALPTGGELRHRRNAFCQFFRFMRINWTMWRLARKHH